MWYYKNEEFTEELIDDNYGFIYLITNTVDKKYYIGRKFFTKSKRYQVKNKKKTKRVSSDWRDYFGSNKTLLEDVERLGKDVFRREILHLCKKRGQCNYLEAKEILVRDAIIRDDFYNSWLSIKIQRSHL
jgi:hypothetical protein